MGDIDYVANIAKFLFQSAALRALVPFVPLPFGVKLSPSGRDAEGVIMEIKPIVSFLGGKKTLKRNVGGVDDLIKAIKEGLPYEALLAVSKKLEKPEFAILNLISPSTRTAARRSADRGRLKDGESEKLVRLIRVANAAETVFGSIAKANKWLNTPLRALGEKTPFTLLDSDLGARQVEEILERIDEGVIS